MHKIIFLSTKLCYNNFIMKFKFDRFLYALAPMAGVTDFAFRKICADFGADMTTTEMVSAKALDRKSKKTELLLYELDHKAIKCVQLFGHEANVIERVCKSGLLDNFDIIDFNCGCPAPKIVKNKDGSAMMADLENSKKVISALVQNTTKPVSVKFRLGINGVENYVEFGKMCEECGASFLILHARTREQMYSGKVDLLAYKKLKDAVSIPVIASGDIKDFESVEIIKNMGLDGVMIGRASMGNPMIFSDLKGTNKPYNLKNIATEHFDTLLNFNNNAKKIIPYFRKHLAWYVKEKSNASTLRQTLFKLESIKEIKDFIINNL